jgi:nucleotide-binding universal stress UspA family protein
MIPHHVLVPLDFSEPANQALEYAMQLARQLHGRLTLLHVIHIPPLGGADLTAYMAHVETGAQQAMEECLQRVQYTGLPVQSLLVQGVPWQEIVDKAKDTQADLIVMSTHGRTGFQHLLLGSVAERVVRLAPCPVLVTRPSAQASAAGGA